MKTETFSRWMNWKRRSDYSWRKSSWNWRKEDQVKVKEHVEIDPNIDFGIGLDAGLNLEKITSKVIEKFIKDFNEDTLSLDNTLYSFQTEDEAADG